MTNLNKAGVGLLLVSSLLGIASCQQLNTGSKPAAVAEIRPGILAGYLTAPNQADSLALVPPPPALGSAAMALDEAVSRQRLTEQGSARWQLAMADADLSFPAAAGTFSCAVKAPITEQQTPFLYQLLRRTLADAGLSTSAAKNHYQRKRPFMVNHAAICTPAEQASLEKNGSYPSGHTAIGWAWALILSEIAPAQADAILARGIAFGESRNVCNVHWHSDVIQGRVMAAATVARLHADPVFVADLAKAKAELATQQARGLAPTRDCASEAAALKVQ